MVRRERRLLAESSHSQIRRRVVLHQNSYDRFRLEAVGRVIEFRQAENDPKRTFGTTAQSVLFLPINALRAGVQSIAGLREGEVAVEHDSPSCFRCVNGYLSW